MKVWKLIGLFLAVALIAVPCTAQAAGSGNPVLEKLLGAALFKDKNLSINQNQSCMSCHHPSAAFADPDNVRMPGMFPVSDGSDGISFGGRNAPTAAYSGFAPKLHWNNVDGLFIGGIFWDGRASGQPTSGTAEIGGGPTGDPLADQAKGPFLNDVEMAMADELAVVSAVRSANYAWLFQLVYPGVLYGDVGAAYNCIATAIGAFERSLVVNQFNSRFDKFLREQGGDVSTFGVEVDPVTEFRKYVGPPKGFKSKYFTKQEAIGLALFNADSEQQLGVGDGTNKGGMCYLCHLTENHVVVDDSNRPVNGPAPGTYNPIFTDFSYDNLGLPVNPRIAKLAGPQGIDYGLGANGRLKELQSLYPGVVVGPVSTTDSTLIAVEEQGKFKVSSLRNIADTAPYGHNGFFADLKSIVHFYNARPQVLAELGTTSEVPETVNESELGNLGLSPAQEAAIVAFLKTLSD